MTLRTTVIGAIALLLAAAAYPGLRDLPAARAQQVDGAMAGTDDNSSPPELDSQTLRKRIKALRYQIRTGRLAHGERREARHMIRAYRAALTAQQDAGGAEPPPIVNEPAEPGAGSAKKPPAKPTRKKTQVARTSNPPESTTSKPASKPLLPVVAKSDCNDVWNEANENGDDVLTDDEAEPFIDALGTKSKSSTGAIAGSERTISHPQFTQACMKGAFKGLM